MRSEMKLKHFGVILREVASEELSVSVIEFYFGEKISMHFMRLICEVVFKKKPKIFVKKQIKITLTLPI